MVFRRAASSFLERRFRIYGARGLVLFFALLWMPLLALGSCNDYLGLGVVFNYNRVVNCRSVLGFGFWIVVVP